MKKISCIIVDDEPLALNLVEGYVKKTPFLELKARCSNAFEALEIISVEKVDLIFLDIQMPDLNGLELSGMIKSPARVIFTTAFEKFALEGFKAEALDFLLKPFDYNDFLKATMKAKEWFDLVWLQKQPDNGDNYIFVKSEYKQIKIMLNDILYIEGLKDYVKIWLEQRDNPVLSLMSLKSLEETLPAKDFMRIHRSFIIHLSKIQSIERSQVIIKGNRITVAEQYREKFLNYISQKSV